MINLVSVLLPVYNVERYISACLNSVVDQTFKNLEIVIVDDGSTDNSWEICNQYAKRDSRIVLVSQVNKGLAGARNTALNHARGDCIAFIDSDDFVTLDYVEMLVDRMERFSADIVACGRWRYSEKGAVEEHRPAFSNNVMNGMDALRALNSYRSFDMSMCSKLVRRDLFEGERFPEGKLSEDQFVCYRLLAKAHSVYYDSRPLYYYRQRIGSISRNSKVNTYPIEASREQLRFLLDAYPELRYAGETSCLFSRVAVFNAFVIRGKSIPEDTKTKIDNNRLRYLAFALKNPDLSIKKKIQGIAFCLFRPLYKKIYLSYQGRLM